MKTKEGRNLLFFDVDGVINNTPHREEKLRIVVDESPIVHKQGLTLSLSLDPTNLHFFNTAYRQILDKYNTQVILSSTWRYHDECYKHLIDRGLVVNFGGKTGFDKTRALEILGYIDENDKYLVVDDEVWDIHGEKARKHGKVIDPHRVLQIDSNKGFTSQDHDKLLTLADQIYGAN